METDSKFVLLSRLGFAARGLTYALLGYFAAKAAFGNGEIESRKSILANMASGPFESALLVLIALGLAGYGLWRITGAVSDSDDHGSDASGLAVRIGHFLSGLAHAALAAYALFAVISSLQSSGSDSMKESGASWLLAQSWGEFALYAIAAGFAVTGLFQLRKAYRLKFLKHLEPAAAQSSRVKWLGRLGYAARAVVFSFVGYLLYRAALTANADQVAGFAGALKELQQQTSGPWVLGLTAIGLILFGLFSTVEARYRVIGRNEIDV